MKPDPYFVSRGHNGCAYGRRCAIGGPVTRYKRNRSAPVTPMTE